MLFCLGGHSGHSLLLLYSVPLWVYAKVSVYSVFKSFKICYYFLEGAGCMACGTLVPWPGIEPRPLRHLVKVPSPNLLVHQGIPSHTPFFFKLKYNWQCAHFKCTAKWFSYTYIYIYIYKFFFRFFCIMVSQDTEHSSHGCVLIEGYLSCFQFLFPYNNKQWGFRNSNQVLSYMIRN